MTVLREVDDETTIGEEEEGKRQHTKKSTIYSSIEVRD